MNNIFEFKCGASKSNDTKKRIQKGAKGKSGKGQKERVTVTPICPLSDKLAPEETPIISKDTDTSPLYNDANPATTGLRTLQGSILNPPPPPSLHCDRPRPATAPF